MNEKNLGMHPQNVFFLEEQHEHNHLEENVYDKVLKNINMERDITAIVGIFKWLSLEKNKFIFFLIHRVELE